MPMHLYISTVNSNVADFINSAYSKDFEIEGKAVYCKKEAMIVYHSLKWCRVENNEIIGEYIIQDDGTVVYFDYMFDYGQI